MESLDVTERWRVDLLPAAGLEDGRPLGHLQFETIDADPHQPLGLRHDRTHRPRLPFPLNRPSRKADSVAADTVCPSPQIDASRIAPPMSDSIDTSSSEPPLASRYSASSCRTVPTRQGTHCPQDSSRKKRAIRSTMAFMSTESSKTMTTPEPSVTPAARVASNVSGRSKWSLVTNEPAAPPSRIACSRPWTPPARSSTCRRVRPKG